MVIITQAYEIWLLQPTCLIPQVLNCVVLHLREMLIVILYVMTVLWCDPVHLTGH